MAIFESIDPRTGQTIATYPHMPEQELQQTLERAEQAFLGWRQTTFAKRGRLLLRVADLLEARASEYAALMGAEMGKLPQEAEAEVRKSAWVCRYYAQQAEEFLRPERTHTELGNYRVHFQPIGAVLAIMPWNYPFWQVFRFCAPALMAGNVSLLKHAPNVMGCAQAIESLMLEAGLPQGVFQSLRIDIPALETVLAAPIVQGLGLTGSERAGASAAALAGKHIKKSILELGGSDPFIVFPDADLAEAARIGVQSRMGNAGQACIAAKRFLVHEQVVEAFAELVVQEVAALDSGLGDGRQLACMARTDLAEQLERQLQESLAMGAQLRCGGKREDTYFPPTVLTGMRPDMPCFREETFGPLLCIGTFADEQQALQLANDSRYGLGGSVWTQDEALAQRMALQLEVGSVAINAMVKSDPRLPFGGTRKSGYGRELSHYGIREFVNAKTVFLGAM